MRPDFDHFHFFLKIAENEKRKRENVQIYFRDIDGLMRFKGAIYTTEIAAWCSFKGFLFLLEYVKLC